MKTIAFFSNKGEVGTTLLVYHLAWMFEEIGCRVIAVDLDPQANLSGMFLGENRLGELCQNAQTIDGSIAPLFEGAADVSAEPHIEKISEKIGLLVGDLALSRREDDLSEQWLRCLDREKQAFCVIIAFARLVAQAGEEFQADLALIDTGPNLGAINRAALMASDYVVMPLAPDLSSLPGLANAGLMLGKWKEEWKDRIAREPKGLGITLPKDNMKPLGYIVMRRVIRLYRSVRAVSRWIEKIPMQYRQAVLQESSSTLPAIDADEHLLADLKDYRVLMPMAQEANKPMFMLKPADGALGTMQNAARSCYDDFRALAEKIIDKLEEEAQMVKVGRANTNCVSGRMSY